MERFGDFCFKFVLIPSGVLMLALLLVMITVLMPAALIAERDCLAKGYPKAKITFMLERYCMTLDGAVTVRMEQL